MKEEYMLHILSMWAVYCKLLVKYKGTFPNETSTYIANEFRSDMKKMYGSDWGESTLPQVITEWFERNEHPLVKLTLVELSQLKRPRTTEGTVGFFEELIRRFELMQLRKEIKNSFSIVEESNPIQNLKERENVTLSGTGGRTSRSLVLRTRAIYEVELGREYVSHSTHTKVKVLGFCKHAQDCSVSMVRFTNLNATVDSPAGTEWVLEESIFLKRFKECM